MDPLPADCVALVIHATLRHMDPEDKLMQLWLIRGISTIFKRLVDDDRPEWFVVNGYPLHGACGGGRLACPRPGRSRGQAFVRAVLRISAHGEDILDWACGGRTAAHHMSSTYEVFAGPLSFVACDRLHVLSLAASVGRSSWLARFPSRDVAETAANAMRAGHFDVAHDAFRQLLCCPTALARAVDNFMPDMCFAELLTEAKVRKHAAACELLVQMKRESRGRWRKELPAQVANVLLVRRALQSDDGILACLRAPPNKLVGGLVHYHVGLAGKRHVLDQLESVGGVLHIYLVLGALAGSQMEALRWVDTWWQPGYEWPPSNSLLGPRILFPSGVVPPEVVDWIVHHELARMVFAWSVRIERGLLPYLGTCSDRPCLRADAWLRSVNENHPTFVNHVSLSASADHVLGTYDPEDLESAGLISNLQRTDPHLARKVRNQPHDARSNKWLCWMDPACWDASEWPKRVADVIFTHQWSTLAKWHGQRNMSACVACPLAQEVIDYLENVGHVPACDGTRWYPPSKRFLLCLAFPCGGKSRVFVVPHIGCLLYART